MVGIFSRFTGSKTGHRRTQSALDEREVALQNPQDTESDVAQSVIVHGIEVTVEFKPVEHPIEPLDSDKPVQCPLPEPSILNDGRIWKERVSAANVMRRTDLPLMKEGSTGDSEAATETRSRPPLPNRMILPSISAPEHNLVNLLEECKSSGII
ncbi:unnamed protein product [Amaranthus hypochondriacus]